jgi:hypothetical protein
MLNPKFCRSNFDVEQIESIPYTRKIEMFVCVVQTTKFLYDSYFAQISTFFTQNLCGFHQIAQISIKITQINGENHTKYLCTDLSHNICVTSLADIELEIFVRITRIELHEWSSYVIYDKAL